MEKVEYDARAHRGRLLKYNAVGLKVMVRPENRGAEITNSLPKFQKIELDPLSLDVVTNVIPLAAAYTGNARFLRFSRQERRPK